ncbi:MAG TPA: hypothetical protein VKU01_21225 [Bryobacteraceae bacterium]|nr:hypothetical protein [Bryobacteraceae bacterium]
MKPSEFLKLYTDLNVFVVPPQSDVDQGAWTPVHVKKYHLGTSPFKAPLWADVSPKVSKGSKVRVKTIEGKDSTSDVLNHTQLSNLFRWPFAGKGSPEQVQATIQLLYRYRQNKSTVQQFAGGVGTQNEYNFIGLDCNGFVGNYLQRVAFKMYDWWNQNNERHPGPDSLIKDLFIDTTDPVYSMAEFGNGNQSICLFVFCSETGDIYDHGHGPGGAGHIMITDPGILSKGPDGVHLTVSESTAADIGGSGGGPVTSEYIIKSVQKEGNKATRTGTVFLVWRGGSSAKKMYVKIGKLKTKA